jgi:hypothetical protein
LSLSLFIWDLLKWNLKNELSIQNHSFLTKIEEVLMYEESDEELEDEVMESRVQSSSSSEDEDDAEETEVAFRAARAGESSIFFYFTGPPNGVNQSAASDINAESSPF